MQKIVLANWKMHGDCAYIRHWAATFKPPMDITVGVCPPALYLQIARESLFDTVLLGGQNVSRYKGSGAYTGEISADMLVEMGCQFVLIGHSERRWLLGENDEDCAKKCHVAMASGLKAVLCVGETAQLRAQGRAIETVLAQINCVLEKNNEMLCEKLIIAYEPVWAIGSGKTPSSEDIISMHFAIREFLIRKTEAFGDTIPLLYGGSVNETNAKSIAHLSCVDGLLVGGASLDATKLTTICKLTK